MPRPLFLNQPTNPTHSPFILAPAIESRLTLLADSCRAVKTIRGVVNRIPVVLLVKEVRKKPKEQ